MYLYQKGDYESMRKATLEFAKEKYFNGVMKWIKSCLFPCFGMFKMPFLIFVSILVFRPEGQIWNLVRRETKTYVRRILNASRIEKSVEF